jgi:hypothetical protein
MYPGDGTSGIAVHFPIRAFLPDARTGPPMFKTLLVAARDRHRLAEMTRIASRFGLNVLVARLGLDGGAQEDGDDPRSLPMRTRLALEELGPTFIKLGQILATRGDLLPPEWIAELEQLHSQAPTLPFEDLRADVEEALGAPPEEVFASFDPIPLAAASMAQVHRATLTDGRPVVLKIRRPGIRPRIEADLRLIAQGAALAESASAEARRFAPVAMVHQLAQAILGELDFTHEGRNADLLREDFAREPRVTIPGSTGRGAARRCWSWTMWRAPARAMARRCAARGWTRWPSRRWGRTLCWTWCWSTGGSMAIRIRAICCACRATAWHCSISG